MNTTITSFFSTLATTGLTSTNVRRAAMALAVMMLTATTAWAQATRSVTYYDPVSMTNKTVTANYIGNQTLTSGWYYYDPELACHEAYTINGTVNLILLDDPNREFMIIRNIKVTEGNTLNIYAQSTNYNEMGGISTATYSDGSDYETAAIGGGSGESCGTINIYGGIIKAEVKQGSLAAAIGGGYKGHGGTVSIYGGYVTAIAKDGGAGIGSGYFSEATTNTGTVNIYGGTVTASGGVSGTAGIGGGYHASGGTINITGGTVTAQGGTNGFTAGGAGIGGGAGYSGGITAYASGLKYGGRFYIMKADVSLANDADNSGSIIDKQVADVRIQGRTLYKDGDWNTLCLPFDVTIAGSVLDGADVRELDNANISDATLTLNFTAEGYVTKLTAGTPYIIKWDGDGTNNLVNPVFTDVTVSTDTNNFESTDGSVQFKGTYNNLIWTTQTPSILLMGANNALFWPDGVEDSTLGACRAYFQLADGQQARQFVLNFGEDNATGIIATDYTDYTDKAGVCYTLDGRKLNTKPTKKGVYVVKGKKVVLK